jgi:hypothetical protein
MPQAYTLFVIALLNRRDQYHAQADEMAELYDGQPPLTTDAILLEIGNAMARAFKPEAAQVMRRSRNAVPHEGKGGEHFDHD